jgi:hypothetical protein
MNAKLARLSLGLLAACCFAILPGCADTTTTTTDAVDTDHGHGDDHDGDHHDHGGHEGHDHDAEHDHDGEHAGHAPEIRSLAEAVVEIEALRDTIRDEFAAGDADAAHGPLHDIGTVLIATESCIEKMNDSDQKTDAAAAVESLIDDFGAIDQGMHGSEESKSKGKTYDEVSKSIDEAIDRLKKDSK